MPSGPLFVRVAPTVTNGGNAEPAMFVHGLGGASTNWTDLMDRLSRPDERRPTAPVLRCSALDLPGFGFSLPPIDGDYRISAHARAVIDLIDKQGNWPVHLIGNSLGGAVSTRVAARRPDLVRTLTLISPALPDPRPRPLPVRVSIVALPGVGKAIMDWYRRQPADHRVDQTIRDIFADPGLYSLQRREEEIAEVTRRDGLYYSSRALILSARSLVAESLKAGPTSLWRDAVRVTAPVLVIYGGRDKLVSAAMAAKAARAFRNGRVLVVPGVGHVAMMEQPTLVAEEIRSFLESVRSSGPHRSATARYA